MAYKMGLLYNGLYRMMELSKLYLTRDSVNDVLLIPAILEKLYQLQVNSSYFNMYKIVIVF